MIPEQHWARQFTISNQDIDDLLNHLLETETPMRTRELARRLVEQRLNAEAAVQRERMKDVLVYDPASTYKTGDKLIFPALNFATGVVTGERESRTAEGEMDAPSFRVAQVKMDDSGWTREFAAGYTLPHKLNASSSDGAAMPGADTLTADAVLKEVGRDIVSRLDEKLRGNTELVSLAGRWFPRSLMMEVNIGHLNLAEAVLDIGGGGPMNTGEILDEIGGLGNAPPELQVFSMNYALNQDARFDEVGAVNQVLWYLKRLEPAEVQNPPFQLRYTPLEYDASLLTAELQALETEIDDEWSNDDELDEDEADDLEEVELTLTYPHRRAGTMPLNARMRAIFPTARKTDRIFITLVDGQDGEEFSGWVVRTGRYVYGMSKLYRKYRLPVGAAVLVSPHEDPSRMIVDFRAQRQRTEYVRLVVPENGIMTFEEEKRAINADYDDLIILGADDIASVDALHQNNGGPRRSLAATLRSAMSELARLAPQGNVHAKTLYSVINVVRRVPPGPVFAALVSGPEYVHVGNNYWRLVEE